MTFDLQGSYTVRGCPIPLELKRSYTVRGCPMTTGAQEVTTVDELQLRLSKTVQDYR